MAAKADQKRIVWLGLTGGIATGKSTVAEIFRRRGIPVVDADQVAREVVGPQTEGLHEVLNQFGRDILSEDGGLDRAKLGQIVFKDRKKLDLLESILHPLIRTRVEEIKADLSRAGHHLAVYDVPLLFEKNMEDMFDGVIVVTTRPDLQLQRFIARNGLDETSAKERIAQQLPMDVKIKKAKWVIDNSGGIEDLEKQIEPILLFYSRRS